MHDLTSVIKALAMFEGISLVGIASAKGWNVTEGRRPRDVLPDAKSVIVMAIQMPDKVIEEASPEERRIVKKAREDELARVGTQIIGILAENGFKGVTAISPVYKTPESSKTSKSLSTDWEYMRGSISLKHAAQLAGLGAVGKSSLLITPQYGPRVRLAAIITNAPLTPDKPLERDPCGKCMVCEKVCIAKAINEGRNNVETCWRAEMELGEPIPGTPYKLCPAPCLKYCPAGKLKEKWQIA
ncbi:MAG TPA: hypothetical protein VJ574_00740 [Candidatus Bathyarchaeia archaeon]|nr:MAG: hypothetical protein A3K70_00745 [Candidatus Bathyarchaeota archaeon RBG_16_48_13]HJX22922.1 hypothetical protein [Candidatus Bathyarchaeia archaeon]